MNQGRIVLCCCSDEGYAPHASTMLLSALSNTPNTQFVIHYLQDPSFSDVTRALVRQALQGFGKRAELHFHTIDADTVRGLPLFKFMTANEIPPVMWYRVFLPQLLPNETKVLYLDCDTLVLDSLEPLWDTPLQNMALAAVTNPSWSSEQDSTWHNQVGLDNREDYFNSGVMLLNLDYFRQHDLTRKVVEHGRANADWTRYGDQDSLVALLHKLRVHLAPRWNAMRMVVMTSHSRQLFGAQQMRDVIQNPAIIHFEGSTKPWIDPTRHPFGRAHAAYARKLPWPVKNTPYSLLDIENFLTRMDWIRLRKQFRRARLRLQKVGSA